MKIVVYIALIIFSLNIFAQKKKELEQKKQSLQKEIKLTNKLLEETKMNKKLSLNQLVTLNKKITIREELIGTMNDEISVLDRRINKNKNTISQLEVDLKNLKDEYARMIYFAYKNKGAYDRLMFVFSSESFNQAYARLKYLQQYSSYRQKQGELIIETEVKISRKIQELELRKAEKLGLVEEQKGEINTLSGEKSEKEKIFVQLQDKEKQLKQELKKKQEDAQKLQQAIQQIIQEEIKKAKEEARKTAEKEKKEGKKETTTQTKASGFVLNAEAEKLSNNFEANKGKLPWPVTEGVIISDFGEHEHPVLKNIKTKNNGIDIQTNRNALANVVFDGEVSGVISIPNSGTAIIIRHGEFLTVYSNLKDVFVKKGDKVKTKQTVGVVDLDEETGKSEVHFELWKGNVTLNPELWIRRR